MDTIDNLTNAEHKMISGRDSNDDQIVLTDHLKSSKSSSNSLKIQLAQIHEGSCSKTLEISLPNIERTLRKIVAGQ